MSTLLTCLLFGVGVAGWAWSKVSRQTGNADPKSVVITAGGIGLIAFIVLFTLMKFAFGF
jgi:hypothetical protein